MRDFKISNRWKIVLIITLFNLLAEYSLRGINGLLAHPELPLFLFLIYFAYFTMVEDLIVRYRLKDYHVIVAAFFFALLFQFLFPQGGVFVPPLILGINWGVLLFVNLIFWCPIQTMMGFYLANRVTPRDWSHPLLSKIGWGLSLFVFVSITLGFRLFARNIAQVTLLGIVVMIGLMIATVAIFIKIRPSQEERSSPPTAFEKRRLMDYLCIFIVVFFFISAIFLTGDPTYVYAHPINRTALQIGMIVSTIVVLIMLGYRLYSRKPIPV